MMDTYLSAIMGCLLIVLIGMLLAFGAIILYALWKEYVNP